MNSTPQPKSADRSTSLKHLPPEIHGEISKHLDHRTIYRIKKMTGDGALEQILSRPSADLLSGPVRKFNLSKPGEIEVLINLLQSSLNGVKLKLIDVTVEKLRSILPHCKSVISLDLSYNQIGDAGAQTISQRYPFAQL